MPRWPTESRNRSSRSDPPSFASRNERSRRRRPPDKLRVPFVLCELEGRTNAEAAAALGCPLGTVESRLTRAGNRLRTWLRARGVAPALAVVAASFPESIRAALVSVGATRSVIKPPVRMLAERAVRSAAGAEVRFVLAIGVAMIAAAIGFGLEVGDPQKTPDAPPATSARPNTTEAEPCWPTSSSGRPPPTSRPGAGPALSR